MADFTPNPRAAATTITGQRGPENVNSVRVVADVEDEIFMYQPSSYPLTTLSGKVRKKRMVSQYRYDVLTVDEFPRSVTSSTTYLVGDTSVVLSAGQGARVAKYSVLLNMRTGESLYVTNVSTDTLTVTRGIGSNAAAINAGDTFVVTRQVFEDGAAKGDLKTVKEANDYNYTEILRTFYGVTGRQANTKLYGGADLPLIRKMAGIEHAKGMEFMLFFGTRHSITGTHLTTFSGGLDYWLSSNVWNLDGTVPSERSFIEALEDGMREGKGGSKNGSRTKYLFHSSRWGTEINFWGHDRIRIEPGAKALGLNISSLDTPHGKVMLVNTPILDYYHPDRAYLLDLNHIRLVQHEGRGTKIVKDIQNNDVDGTEEEYRSDVGAEVTLEAAHMTFKGLSV